MPDDHVVIEAPALVLPPTGPEPTAKMGAERQTAEIEASARTKTGQRRINIIWEGTQCYIAVIGVTSLVVLAYGDPDVRDSLENMVFAIIGFYFNRMNHQNIGGIGSKPGAQAYEGR